MMERRDGARLNEEKSWMIKQANRWKVSVFIYTMNNALGFCLKCITLIVMLFRLNKHDSNQKEKHMQSIKAIPKIASFNAHN